MSYPNHSVTAIVIDSRGQRARTSKQKFFAEPNSSFVEKDKLAREKVSEIFCNPKAKNPNTIESITITKLPPVKLGAKLNSQHEYISLTANFLDGTLRFTTSYGGYKISGDFHGPEASALIRKWKIIEGKGKKDMGEKMEDLRRLAHESKTMAEFLEKIPA